MKLFPWIRQRTFFTEEEREAIVEAVQKAEQRTSGEVRIFIENRCSYMDAVDRAKELFQNLKMDQTRDRNAVLLYLAMKDRQLAIFGDEGIHRKVGNEYWQQEVRKMIAAFRHNQCATAVIVCVNDIAEVLYKHFPYEKTTDKNELPDDIVFGR